MRIVSLLPSATEIVCALGAGEELVGRSHECDHPGWVQELPVCTAPKFEADGTSYQIEERVKALLQEGLSVYRVRGEALRELRPDLVVTQDQCEVCAASLDDVRDAVERFLDPAPRVVSLRPLELEDVWSDVGRVARALGVVEEGRDLVSRLRERMEAVARKAGSLDDSPSVAVIEWMDPLMAGGNWMPSLVRMAGGRSLFGEAGTHSPLLEWDEVREAAPDVVLVIPCGFGISRTLEEIGLLTRLQGWEELPAVREGRVYVADGHHYFNRPGPRIVESLEILAEVLHPRVFHYGRRGGGWVRVKLEA